MNRHCLLGMLAAGATFVLGTGTAAADEPAPPPPPPPPAAAAAAAAGATANAPPAAAADDFFQPWVERTITLPQQVIIPSVVFFGLRLPDGTAITNLSVGGLYGIIDNLSLVATVAGVSMTPGRVKFGNPAIALAYEFVNQPVLEVAATVGATFNTINPEVLNLVSPLEAGIPLWVHFGHAGRLETGVSVPISFGGGPPTSVGLKVPMNLVFQPHKNFHVGLATGLTIDNFDKLKTTLAVPLGAIAGFSTNLGHGFWLDIVLPFFRFHQFLTPGGKTKLNVDTWQVVAVTELLFKL